MDGLFKPRASSDSSGEPEGGETVEVQPMFWWGKKDISALPRLRKSWVTPLVKSASKSAPAARRCAMLVIVEWKAVAFCSLRQINRKCLATGSWPAWRVSAPIGLQLS